MLVAPPPVLLDTPPALAALVPTPLPVDATRPLLEAPDGVRGTTGTAVAADAGAAVVA
jgi:hypothetical protein